MTLEAPSQPGASVAAGKSGAALYQIRVQGCLDDHWADWFEGMALTRDITQNTTTLSGVLPDQAALHGLLAQIRDLGLPLLSLGRLEIGT
jgi:hypothetical protein